MFHDLTPIFRVKDVPSSIDYYVRVLGFKKLWDWGTPPTFGAVGRDRIEIFFCQGCQGQPGTWLSIFVDDVDAIFEEYKASGATIRQPPTNFPWGMREMNVQDPDGHRLRIGSGYKGTPDGVPLCVD